MRAKLNFPISLLLLCVLISWSSELAGQTQQSAVTIPDSLKNTYHLSWVWPDSMPTLLPDFYVDDSGRVCIGDYNGNLYLLNDSGEILLKLNLNEGFLKWSLINGNIMYYTKLTGGADDYIYVIDLNERKQILEIGPFQLRGVTKLVLNNNNIWGQGYNNKTKGLFKINSNGKYDYLPFPEHVNGRFQGLTSTGNIIVYDYDQAVLYYFSPELKIINQITLEKSRLFEEEFGKDDGYWCTGYNGEVMAFYEGGRLKWKYIIDQYGHNKYISVIKENKTGKVVYCASGDGTIKAINNSDGILIWQRRQADTLSRINCVEEIYNDTIFVLNSDAQIDVISPEGQLVWHHEMYDTGRAEISQIPNSGNIFVMQSGKLYKFGRNDTCYIEQPNEVSLPENQAQAENEITEYMLEYIGEMIGGLTDYLSTQSDFNAKFDISAPAEDIIIYYAMRELDNTKESALDWDKPKSVWLTAGGLLFPADDKSKAIKDFDKRTKKDSMKPWSYGQYNFGIRILNREFTKAEIIYHHSCGFMCGDGSRMILRRSPSGKWWISRHLESWIS